MEELLIKTQSLSFSIKSQEILKEIDVSINKYQFVGLVGPNGSGKTTFIKHLYKELEPERNTVFIYNKNLEDYEQKELAKTITVMKQENVSDFEFSVYQMVLMGRAPYRSSYEAYHNEDEVLAEKYLKSGGMYEKRHQLFSTLSGGEKQRVLIARALIQDTAILLLDEPTNHLDIFHQLYLMETLRALHKTIIAVFHDLNLAAQFCDYLYVLKDGSIVAKGPPEHILTIDMFRTVFNISVDIIDNNGKPHIIYQNAHKE